MRDETPVSTMDAELKALLANLDKLTPAQKAIVLADLEKRDALFEIGRAHV